MFTPFVLAGATIAGFVAAVAWAVSSGLPQVTTPAPPITLPPAPLPTCPDYPHQLLSWSAR